MARLEIDTKGRRSNAYAYTFTLSRRNLLTLLHKLDMPGSARTITNRYIYVDGVLVNAICVIKCENDFEHYGERGEAPGTMHIDSEEFIANPPEDL